MTIKIKNDKIIRSGGDTVNQKSKNTLKLLSKLIGVVFLIFGGVLLYFGFYDFITSLIDNISPSLFMCSLFGIPVFSIGIFLTAYGFTNNVSLYIKKHSLEPQDSKNGRVEVKVVTSTDIIPEIEDKHCTACGTLNDIDSKYCKICGTRL